MKQADDEQRPELTDVAYADPGPAAAGGLSARCWLAWGLSGVHISRPPAYTGGYPRANRQRGQGATWQPTPFSRPLSWDSSPTNVTWRERTRDPLPSCWSGQYVQPTPRRTYSSKYRAMRQQVTPHMLTSTCVLPWPTSLTSGSEDPGPAARQAAEHPRRLSCQATPAPHRVASTPAASTPARPFPLASSPLPPRSLFLSQAQTPNALGTKRAYPAQPPSSRPRLAAITTTLPLVSVVARARRPPAVGGLCRAGAESADQQPPFWVHSQQEAVGWPS